jgi:hypothetical protein
MLETFTAALPVLLSTICCVPLAPTATEPKLKLAGFADNCPVGAAAAVPLNATLRLGLFGSLLAIVRFPVSLPVPVGLNVTLPCTDWPALIVWGVVIPFTANKDPVTPIEEIVRFAVPVLFKTSPAVPFEPTVTVPKLIALGVTDSCGCAAVAAVAERFATTGALPESPVTVSVPVILPAALASTATLKLLDWPTPSASGMFSPETLNCAFETLACVTCIAKGPGFVTDTDCVTCFPMVTFPKLMLLVLS